MRLVAAVDGLNDDDLYILTNMPLSVFVFLSIKLDAFAVQCDAQCLDPKLFDCNSNSRTVKIVPTSRLPSFASVSKSHSSVRTLVKHSCKCSRCRGRAESHLLSRITATGDDGNTANLEELHFDCWSDR